MAALGMAACGSDDKPTEAAAEPGGVVTFEGLSRNHVQQVVDYEQDPPAGGDHAPVWQNCGVYDEPIVTELGVHSLEHGAVWITYRSDLPEQARAELRDLAIGQPFVLVSPWPADLPSPVVASAWGRQLAVDSVADQRLAAFIRSFQQGPQTPEPGAPCTGGQSTP